MNLIKIIIFAVLIIVGKAQSNDNQTPLDRIAFYEAMKSGNLTVIENQLKEVSQINDQSLDAFRGALLMRKADLLNQLKSKISTFKLGHDLLEAMILKDKSNVEFRFLRLMIQENVPKVIKYQSHIEEDKTIILNSFSSLPSWFKKILKDYGKSSNQLGELQEDKYK